MLKSIFFSVGFMALTFMLDSSRSITPHFHQHQFKTFKIADHIKDDDDRDDIIMWDEQRLSWDLYQGHADYSATDIAAITASGIVSWKGCKDDKIDYEIHACFDKYQSWVKPEGYTPYCLGHEQGHFDITEIYARKLHAELKNHSFKCGEEEQFERFINDFLLEWEMTEKQYDLDTNWSTDRAEQAVWVEKIELKLAKELPYPKATPIDGQ